MYSYYFTASVTPGSYGFPVGNQLTSQENKFLNLNNLLSSVMESL